MTKIELKKSTLETMPIVLSMSNFYRYDLSEFMGWRIEDDGMHRCYGLEKYWSEKNHPFIIYVDGELAGFALIESSIDNGKINYDLGEFFVLRKFRHQGVAKIVALELFKRYKGGWSIAQLVPNKPAISFWHKILTLSIGNDFAMESIMDDEVGEMCVMKFLNE